VSNRSAAAVPLSRRLPPPSLTVFASLNLFLLLSDLPKTKKYYDGESEIWTGRQ